MEWGSSLRDWDSIIRVPPFGRYYRGTVLGTVGEAGVVGDVCKRVTFLRWHRSGRSGRLMKSDDVVAWACGAEWEGSGYHNKGLRVRCGGHAMIMMACG